MTPQNNEPQEESFRREIREEDVPVSWLEQKLQALWQRKINLALIAGAIFLTIWYFSDLSKKAKQPLSREQAKGNISNKNWPKDHAADCPTPESCSAGSKGISDGTTAANKTVVITDKTKDDAKTQADNRRSAIEDQRRKLEMDSRFASGAVYRHTEPDQSKESQPAPIPAPQTAPKQESASQPFQPDTPQPAAPVALKTIDSEALPVCQFNTHEYWIPAGTVLEGVLDSEINGEMPGPVRAMIQTAVRADGTKVMLWPQGTMLLGVAQKVENNNQQRMSVSFDRINIYPPINYSAGACRENFLKGEPALDLTGAAGLSGKVNNHFWSLFGAAVVVGVVQGASVATYTNGNNGAVIGLTNGLGQSTAQVTSRILDRYLNRFPTITIPAGKPIVFQLLYDLKVPAYPVMETPNDDRTGSLEGN